MVGGNLMNLGGSQHARESFMKRLSRLGNDRVELH